MLLRIDHPLYFGAMWVFINSNKMTLYFLLYLIEEVSISAIDKLNSLSSILKKKKLKEAKASSKEIIYPPKHEVGAASLSSKKPNLKKSRRQAPNVTPKQKQSSNISKVKKKIRSTLHAAAPRKWHYSRRFTKIIVSTIRINDRN